MCKNTSLSEWSCNVRHFWCHKLRWRHPPLAVILVTSCFCLKCNTTADTLLLQYSGLIVAGCWAAVKVIALICLCLCCRCDIRLAGWQAQGSRSWVHSVIRPGEVECAGHADLLPQKLGGANGYRPCAGGWKTHVTFWKLRWNTVQWAGVSSSKTLISCMRWTSPVWCPWSLALALTLLVPESPVNPTPAHLTRACRTAKFKAKLALGGCSKPVCHTFSHVRRKRRS